MVNIGILVSVTALLYCIGLAWNSVEGKTYKYASACYNSPVKTLEMKCPRGHMLRIARAFYGNSPSGQCSFTHGDCTFDELQNYACVGRQSCNINMPGGTGRQIPTCRKESTYFQVEYECVLVSQTKNICKNSQLSGQSGFISSPGYPLNYDRAHTCQTKVTAPANQKLRLFIVDLNLEKKGMGCDDYLYIRNDLSGVTVCDKRGMEELFDTPSGSFDINFHSVGNSSNKGFWLYYEVYPPMNEEVTPSTAVPTTIVEVKATTHPATNNQQTNNANQQPNEHQEINVDGIDKSTKVETKSRETGAAETDDDLPFAAIVGGVIGSLCFILTILLILLLLQRVKERRDLEKNKHLPFLDVRNQAFQSNSELCPTDGNYC